MLQFPCQIAQYPFKAHIARDYHFIEEEARRDTREAVDVGRAKPGEVSWV